MVCYTPQKYKLILNNTTLLKTFSTYSQDQESEESVRREALQIYIPWYLLLDFPINFSFGIKADPFFYCKFAPVIKRA